MITNIKQQLERDEGRRRMAYRDSIRKLWTIGIGHLLGGSIPTQFLDGLNDQQIDALFAADLAQANRLLDVYLPWWHTIDDVRSGVLQNMAFNLGVPELSHFHQFLGFMRERDYASAAADLAGTLVYRQLPERYGRLCQQLTSGVWV